MQAGFPVDIQAALDNLMQQQRTLLNLLAPGAASVQQSSRDGFIPFSSHRLDMLVNNTVLTPKQIGPHKSILYRGVVAAATGGDQPQAFTQNDYAYYLAGKKDADTSRWMVLQAGKSMEFDFPVDQGWLYIPNPARNPTFAIFETSVVGYVRSYSQQSGASANSITDGSSVQPNAAVSVGTTAVQIVPAGASVRSVTLENQGASTIWIGGALGGGVGPYIAQVSRGTSLAAGERVTIRNTGEISGITAAGTASVSYTIEA